MKRINFYLSLNYFYCSKNVFLSLTEQTYYYLNKLLNKQFLVALNPLSGVYSEDMCSSVNKPCSHE